MELFLNLVWVVLVLATTLMWQTQWTNQARHTHYTPLQQRTGLGCALLLLFFAVSLTDDLHPEITLVEDAGRRHAGVLMCPGSAPHDGAGVHAVSAAILPEHIALEPHSFFSRVILLIEFAQPAFENRTVSERSPPALYI